MIIKTLKVGAIRTNCYYVINEALNQGFIIDPGAYADVILREIEESGATPVAVLLTHGHFDHIMAVDELREKLKIPVFAGEKEERLLAEPSWNWSDKIMKPMSLKADTLLKDEQQLNIAGFDVRIIELPGHTEGCIGIYLPNEKVIFAGDILFAGGYGRTDCPTGDNDKLFASIRNRLLKLPGDTIVYPGHGFETTVDKERPLYE